MTSVEAGLDGTPHTFSDEELAWLREHLTGMRRYVREKRFLRWTLTIGFVFGVLAHAGGYLLRLSAPAEPLGLMAELLYALGWALWTGVVVALIVQIFPEWKQRQLEWYLDSYEAAVRERVSAQTVRGSESPEPRRQS